MLAVALYSFLHAAGVWHYKVLIEMATCQVVLVSLRRAWQTKVLHLCHMQLQQNEIV